jgi:hypothetical protein
MTNLYFAKFYNHRQNTHTRWIFNSPNIESAERFAGTIADTGDRLVYVVLLRELPINMPEGEIVEELS